jgi:hypothetical protein
MALNFSAVDSRQVGLNGLRHERRNRRPRSPQLEIIIGRLAGLIGTRQPSDLRRISGIERGRIFSLVPDQVPHGHTVKVETIDGHAVRLSPFPGIEEPAPTKLMHEPFGMRLVDCPTIRELKTGHARLSRQISQGRRVRCEWHG